MKKRKNESGQSLVVMVLLLLPVLLALIGLACDLGAIAVAQVRAQDAADMAVQDAVKALDVQAYLVRQEIVLSPEAVAVAQRRLTEATGDRVRLTQLAIIYPQARQPALYLVGEVTVETPFLRWLIGRPTVVRQVQALGVPAYGLESAGD